MYVLIFLNDVLNKYIQVKKEFTRELSLFFVRPAVLYFFNFGFVLCVDIYFFNERMMSDNNKFLADLFLKVAKI